MVNNVQRSLGLQNIVLQDIYFRGSNKRSDFERAELQVIWLQLIWLQLSCNSQVWLQPSLTAVDLIATNFSFKWKCSFAKNKA